MTVSEYAISDYTTTREIEKTLPSSDKMGPSKIVRGDGN